MLNLIKEIIQVHGPRPSGSQAETNAQHFMLKKASAYTDQLEFLPFDEYLEARMGKVRYYVIFFFVAMALYWVSPIAAFIVAFVNAVVQILDLMMYRDVLTSFPGRKGTSSNATATLEPQGEVKSTLLLSAHIDSTPEFTWWYKLGHTGVVLTVLCGVMIIFSSILHFKHAFFPGPWDDYAWFMFIGLSPLTIIFWTMMSGEVVQGAQDNLSGISIAFEVFRSFAHPSNKGKSLLKNTRIRFVSFGSEEKGLCGSRAYAKLKEAELKKENAHLINVDNVRVASEITIIHREIMSGTKHSPVLIKGLQDCFAAENVPYKMGVAPIGGSDAISLARRGIPSVTIIGMNSEKHDYTYHTRHDVPENIEPLALEYIKTTLLRFVKDWDAGKIAK